MRPLPGLSLSAHKGEKLAHNFHHVSGQACAGARETNAHVWAKKILAERKEIWIPPGVATAGKERKRAFGGQVFKFCAARLEKREGAIVPDVVLTAGDRELIVEVLVTHACDASKIDKIRKQGTSALEIDLSGLRHAESEEVVASALIGADATRRAPRHWLFNTKIEQANERLSAEIARRETARRAELARIAAKRRAALEMEAQSIIRAAAEVEVGSTESTLSDLSVATSYNLRDYVGLPIEGCGFRVSAMLWQSAILSRVVIERMGPMAGIMPAIIPRLAVEAIYQDCLAHDVPSIPSAELRAAVLAADPNFTFSGDAISRYLAHLEAAGILTKEYFHAAKQSSFVGWRLSSEAGARFRARQAALIEQNRRDERAQERLRFIVDRVPVEERRRFSLDQWLGQPIPGFGARLSDLVEHGGEGWRDFERALAETARMFRDGAPAAETLGLPVEGEIARAAGRERIKQEEAARMKREAEEKAARDRAAWLTQDAIGALGPERGRAWLSESVDEGIRVSLASISESALGEAQRALAAAARQQAEQGRRDREAEECRRKLREAASKVFDSEHTELFLRSTQPRFSASPWNHCTDRRRLDECLALLPGRRRRGKAA